MGIVNRRNAVVGWAVLKLGKQVAKKKARSVVPGTADDSLRPNRPAIVAALAGAGGALLFRRRRRSGGSGEG